MYIHLYLVICLEMETAWEEYKVWSEKEIDAHTKSTYEKANKELQTLIPFEEELVRYSVFLFAC